MQKIIAAYQGQNPTARGPSEAFVIHDPDLISPYAIKRAECLRSTGTRSFGPSNPTSLIELEAEKSVKGYYSTSIEYLSDKDEWHLALYDGDVEYTGQPTDVMIFGGRDTGIYEAINRGRQWLADKCASCVVKGK